MRGFWAGCLLMAGLTALAPVPAQGQTPGAGTSATTPPSVAATTAPAPSGVTTPKSATPAAVVKPPISIPPAGTEPGAPPPGPPPGYQPGAHSLSGNTSAVAIEVPARTVAMLVAKANWDDAFRVIKDTQERVKAAVRKAGLKVIGDPLSVFTHEDDSGFTFSAMLPLAPGSKGPLSGGVTIGQSPTGKAIKFQHRGAYADIDSTYGLVTSYLDEKGLEARDFFIEEYLTPLTSGEDPYLAVDIYVFLRP